MKYIDAEKLKKAIEDKGLDCPFAMKIERLDTLALIDSLQQEQPHWKPSESEDEKIRKWLLECVENLSDGNFIAVSRQDVLFYLEKQKELPFVKDVIPGLPGLYFYDGERMHFQGNPAMEENPYDFAMSQQEKQKEQKPNIEICPHSIKSKSYKEKPAERSLEDDHIIGFVYDLLNEIEWKDDWAMSKDECLQRLSNYIPQKSAEWSEEDEEMLNSCISSIEESKENRYAYKETDGDTSYDHEIAWLKSLRPSWKPSEEQMSMLLAVINDPNNAGSESCHLSLKSLYNELKKL